MKRALWWLVGLLLIAAVAPRLRRLLPIDRDHQPIAAPPPSRADPAGANILLILGDDVGVDKISAMHAHDRAPPTPHVDALAARGMLFHAAYAHPVCSPTRAAVLTGRYPSRTGVGTTIEKDNHWALPLDEVTIPEMLASGTMSWRSAALGKWHLSSTSGPGGDRHPNLQGFDRYAGLLGNVAVGGGWMRPVNWEHFLKTTDGHQERRNAFVLTDEIDDAIEFTTRAAEPWFVLLGLHAAHAPFPVPPDALQPTPTVSQRNEDWQREHAMIHAMDLELGRLFAAMDPELLARTVVIFIGDNGTPDTATLRPFNPDHAKGTLHEEGIHVPMIIAGPGVSPGETRALAHVVDLFPTLARVGGVDLATLRGPSGRPVTLDGVSLWPVLADPSASTRAWVFSEKFAPNGDRNARNRVRMIRDERYKVVVHPGDPDIYDLEADPGEDKPIKQVAGEAEERVAGLRDALKFLEASF